MALTGCHNRRRAEKRSQVDGGCRAREDRDREPRVGLKGPKYCGWEPGQGQWRLLGLSRHVLLRVGSDRIKGLEGKDDTGHPPREVRAHAGKGCSGHPESSVSPVMGGSGPRQRALVAGVGALQVRAASHLGSSSRVVGPL